MLLDVAGIIELVVVVVVVAAIVITRNILNT